jgi:hypothetical protein
LEFSDMFEKFSSNKIHEITFMATDGRTHLRKLIVAFRNLSQLIRKNFCPFLDKHRMCQKHFMAFRPLAVALNQTDGKQRNKNFAISFESRIIETELNREKK